MRVTPILFGAVGGLVYLATVAWSMLPHADHLGGGLVLLYLAKLLVIILVITLFEQVMVAHVQPTWKRLLLIEGGVMLSLIALVMYVFS